MSNYVKYNGKLYKAVDGWADDAKKGEQQAVKLLNEVKKLHALAEKCEKLAESTGAFVSVPRQFAGAKKSLYTAIGAIESAKKYFTDVKD